MIKAKQKNTPTLRQTHPDLVMEWDIAKNASLTPDDVTKTSEKRVWWRCSIGHEWEATVFSRSRTPKCPFCAGKRASKENNLAALHPKLAEEWHPTLNGNLTPELLLPKSNKKVWWKCADGHDWQASISHRSAGSGCPYCAGSRASETNNLAQAHSQVARQWHPVRNGSLTPADVTKSSSKKFWWQCEKGHEWQATVNSRARAGSCPFCSGRRVSDDRNLAVCNPEVAAEWHPSKNDGLKPIDVTPHAARKVWWQCNAGHEWEATIDKRSGGTGCPYCSGHLAAAESSLAALHAELAAEWHPDRNGELRPEDVLPGSEKSVWWQCKKGHDWQAVVNSRVRGNGCAYCSKRRASLEHNFKKSFPAIAAQWHPTLNGSLRPHQFTPRSSKKVWWICDKGHEWKVDISNRAAGNGCPKCNHQTSMPEMRLLAELEYVFSEVMSRHKINKMEVDCFLPSISLGIEYDGSYFHQGKEAKDLKKTKGLSALGVHLLRVREEPLKKLGKLDVLSPPPTLEKSAIDQVLKNLEHFCSKVERRRIREYVASASFLNEEKFQLYRSYFPSPFPDQSLAKQYPNLANEWHSVKNGELSPKNFTSGSNYRAWWICHRGHAWEATIANRSQGSGCPFCAGQKTASEDSLASRFPKVASEWHPDRNGELMPIDVLPGSGRKVWWRCSEGHEWERKIEGRVKGSQCPVCLSIKYTHPALAAEWHATKNGTLTVEDVTKGSAKKVWWKCALGHEWQATVNNRSRRQNCPICLKNGGRCRDMKNKGS